MILRKSFYIRWSAGRSPRVHEVNPGRDPSLGFSRAFFFFVYSVCLCDGLESFFLLAYLRQSSC